MIVSVSCSHNLWHDNRVEGHFRVLYTGAERKARSRRNGVGKAYYTYNHPGQWVK